MSGIKTKLLLLFFVAAINRRFVSTSIIRFDESNVLVLDDCLAKAQQEDPDPEKEGVCDFRTILANGPVYNSVRSCLRDGSPGGLSKTGANKILKPFLAKACNKSSSISRLAFQYMRSKLSSLKYWKRTLPPPPTEQSGKRDCLVKDISQRPLPPSQVDNITANFDEEFGHAGYKQVKLLGKGWAGLVYKVEDSQGKQYAMKIMACEASEREVTIMKDLSGLDFIIKVYSDGQSKSGMWDYYVMPLIGKSINDLMMDGKLKPDHFKKVMKETLKLIKLMHENGGKKGYGHGDLHIGNIAIHPDNPKKLMFIDFGFAEPTIDGTANSAVYNDYWRIEQQISMVGEGGEQRATWPPPLEAFPANSSGVLAKILAPVYKATKGAETPTNPVEKSRLMLAESLPYFAAKVYRQFEAAFNRPDWTGPNFDPDGQMELFTSA